jgi:hypothetical protein
MPLPRARALLRPVRVDARAERVSGTSGFGVGELRHGPGDPLRFAQSRRQVGVRRWHAAGRGRSGSPLRCRCVPRVSRRRRRKAVRGVPRCTGWRAPRVVQLFTRRVGVSSRGRGRACALAGRCRCRCRCPHASTAAPVSLSCRHPRGARPLGHDGAVRHHLANERIARDAPGYESIARDAPGYESIDHIASLMPRRISQLFIGQAVRNPMIMPICMRNQ